MIHLALVFLFAFTQMGVATHEISHFTNIKQHSQQDQKSPSKQSAAEQCAQCLSYAKVASGLALSGFEIPAVIVKAIEICNHESSLHTTTTSAYSARAPPQIISI